MRLNFFYTIILGLLFLIPKSIFAIDPPVINATGNQTYCTGTSLKIVETISITNDPAKPDTDAIYIQISSGYVLGQDLLALANPLLHPTITATWSSLEGKLKLFSPTGILVTYKDFEAAIKDVRFTCSSISPSGTRNFSINIGIGSANYLPSNGHFYEYVPSLGINWTKARNEAAAKNYYGLQGYLATLTAADEAQLAGAQAPGTGWIGGSDVATEGTWKWVTGPEGLANGGTGIVFWIGKGNGVITPPFNYANWNKSGNEPNDSNNNEDYAHITAPALLRPGTWNDLRETGDPITNPNYYPQGYIVEYGGMPLDPPLQISASTTITIPKITSTTPSSICGSGVVSLQASATDGIVSWYTSNTGGVPIATGNLFITPNLTATTSYYVDATNGSCSNGPRTEIIATIKALPSLPQIAISSTSPVLYCLNALAIPLSATASVDCNLNWYTLPTGGTASTTSPTPITTVVGSTTYYVSQTNTISGCESPRAAIIVTVNPLPSAPITNNISFCHNEIATSLTATASANCTLNWYATATGGTSNATSPTPATTAVGTTKYYVSQTITSTGCEGPRAEITATVNPLPTAPVVNNIPYCHDKIAIPLTATASANCTLNWYTSPAGGTSSPTSPTPSTATVGTAKYYVSQTVTATGCEGPRSEIIVTINPLPTAPIANNIVYCNNEIAAPLAATASTDCTLNWYTLPTGGTASTTSPTPIITVAGSTTYYVSQTNTTSGCESPRAAIIVTVNSLPTAPITNNISFCHNEIAASLTATASANCTLNWYATATGGTSNATSPTPATTAVGTTKYYVSQTITSTGCEGPRAEITATVNTLPTAPVVNNIPYCHNEIAIPLTATASANCTLNWYTTPAGGTSSPTSSTPSTATVGTTKYYVSQTITATGCEGPRSEITVTVNPLPIVKDITIVQCDSDLFADGKTLFNLTVNNTEISVNFINEIITYYTSQNGANNATPADLIPNDLAFENTTPTLMDVWSRVTDKTTGCHSVAKITLKVPATNIIPNYKIPFSPVCDDFLDVSGNNTANNNKRDGISTFDFSSTKAIILAQLPTNQVYNINYYKNESDALAELDVITNISNYRNIGYPNSQDIWIRIDSNLDNACYGLGPYLTLNVEALPVANTVIIPRQCDDNNDGIFTFNTSSLESDLLKGQTSVKVTYFDQANNPLKDANGVLITSPFPVNFTSTSQTIKAVVTNNTPQLCFDEIAIQFVVDDSPEAFAVSSSLKTACDDEANPINQDGKFAFDTTTFETTILGGQTGMIIKYYDQNNVLLPSPLPNPFVTNTQNITVTVQNPLNTICIASTIIAFVVNPVPNIDLNLDGLDNELVCSNLSTFFVTLDAGILDGSPPSDYDYIWTKDGIIVGTNSPTIDVNSVGDYTVEVINNSGCSRIRTLTVTASNIATIVSTDVVDLTDVNTVTVNVTGPGDYQYSIDEPTGFWQDSNFFNNVPAGEHVVYVTDKNGCGQVYQEIVIVGVPKFFTPNGDSHNDVWEIKGISKYPQAQVQLFDRYGKYITILNTINKSWDGTYNGSPLPADDYWYILNLGNGKPEIKGHFSLKR